MHANVDGLYSGETSAEIIHGLARARMISNALVAAAELGIADYLTESPKSVKELASATATREEALYRLMRCLSFAGIFEEVQPRTFTQTQLSEVLTSTSPRSVRDLVLMDGTDWFRGTVDGLLYSVRTGESAFDKIHGQGWVEYFQEHPDQAEIFNRGMANLTDRLELPVVDRYDLSWADTIADVGGGTGIFLAEILERYPRKRGILAELPEVVEPARAFLSERGVLDRCDVISVDMFEDLPFKADACILKRVIHDWSDDQAIGILRNCREVISPTGRLLVIEPLASGFMGALMDLVMMTLGGGERTQEDFQTLLSAANLRLNQVLPVTPLVSIVEGSSG